MTQKERRFKALPALAIALLLLLLLPGMALAADSIYLSDLTAAYNGNGAISPAFSASVLSYQIEARATGTISITPTAAENATITVNGEAATSGVASQVTLSYTADNIMEIPIVVSGDNATSSTYTLTVSNVDAYTPEQKYTPVITTQPNEFKSYFTDEIAEPLTISAQIKAEDGTVSYQWYREADDETAPGVLLENATQSTFTPPTDAVSDYLYYCIVTHTVDGIPYTAQSDFGNIRINSREVTSPNILTQPVGADYILGSSRGMAMLRVLAQQTCEGTKTFQWYSNTVSSVEGATPIEGATKGGYTPTVYQEANTTYYYCIVTVTLLGNTATATTDIVKISHMTISEALGADAWAGSGTQADPYLLQTDKDFATLRKLVNTNGVTFSNTYFKVSGDVTLPQDWTPIGAKGAAFGGIFDGDGHTITFANGSLPLFGYVAGGTIQNLNIYGPFIKGYGLVNNYSVGYGSMTIDNVTIKSGSIIKFSGFLGGYASGRDAVTVTNCTIERDVKIGYDAETSAPSNMEKIGSFGGDFNGSLTNCVSYATVYGTNYVGGIVGGKGQTMGPYTISNCAFHGQIIATGKFVGGIAGGGYSGTAWGVASAPNGPCARIYNCYVDGTITGGTCVGGIFGGEEGSVQCWSNGPGYIQNNFFCGTVAATGENAIPGAIIGYMNSLNMYNFIDHNYYLDSSATQGIGGAKYVDTSYPTPTEKDGTIYCDTSTSQTRPHGAMGKNNHNRTDDPLGVDADKLTSAATAAQCADGTITKLLNSGAGTNNNWKQGATMPKNIYTPAEATFTPVVTDTLATTTVDVNAINQLPSDAPLTFHATSGNSNVKQAQLSFAVNAFAAMLANGAMGLTVATDMAEVSLDATALAEIGKETRSKELNLTVAALESSTNPGASALLANGRPVYDISMTAGRARIFANPDNQGSITIKIPYTLQAGESADYLDVVYLNATGQKVSVDFTYAEGYITFTTNHLSLYALDMVPARMALTLTSTASQYCPGNTVTGELWVYALADNTVYGSMQATLEYHSGMFDAPELTNLPAGFTANNGNIVYTPSADSLTIGTAGIKLADVSLTVKNGALSGESTLAVKNAVFVQKGTSNEIDAILDSKTVTVKGYTAALLATYAGAPAEMQVLLVQDDSLTAGQIYQYNSGSPLYYSAAYQRYVAFVPAADTLTEALGKLALTSGTLTAVGTDGDVNSNGRFNIGDAQMVYDIYNNSRTAETSDLTRFAADVNGDQTVSVQDVQVLVNQILGIVIQP